MSKTKEIDEKNISEKEKSKLRNKLTMDICKKYNMTRENLVYLMLKVEHNEVTPDSYVAPSEE